MRLVPLKDRIDGEVGALLARGVPAHLRGHLLVFARRIAGEARVEALQDGMGEPPLGEFAMERARSLACVINGLTADNPEFPGIALLVVSLFPEVVRQADHYLALSLALACDSDAYQRGFEDGKVYKERRQ